MHGRRHARRVGIPVQQVEGERVLAEQVVVDDERPDQVVAAHHVEGRGHFGAFQVAELVHPGLQRAELLLVDEDGQFAGVFEVDHGGEEGRRGDALVLPGRHVGQRAGQQRAADAIADGVDLGLAGGFFDGAERRQGAFEHVVVQGLFSQPCVRVDPRDDEHRMALANGPLDKGILLPEIEDVVLVDPRRHDQQRAPGDRLGRGVELDQLHQIVAENHLAGADGDVLADLEGVFVGHADIEPSRILIQILKKILQAIEKILASGLGRLLQDHRVGGDKIARRQGLDEPTGMEIDLASRLVVQALDVGDRGLQPARGQKIGLLDVIEDVVVAPRCILEALVAVLRRRCQFRLAAHHPRRRALPKIKVVLPQRHVGFNHLRRVGHHARRHLDERNADVIGVH